ncbi:class I SAM-dependent methyltransferase [Acaryochloris marina]|uniref:Methyltransferase putative n=1 Tax=Acaryochloris marina (strain MBIC 11017) TaxID=329726 RepID=B0BZH4_ACAM1|nr:class I SAM-dependent methyltransferase [Acaryochloris marina]ABW30719.1 methyltransferase putative [Acaryochloris marina MBIC11017]BDM79498.1 hypothetical protein AM10699_23660 [Acaryochloris marina MBIC10699]
MYRNSFVKRNKCPICSSKEFKTIYSGEFLNEEVSIYLKNAYGTSLNSFLQSVNDANYSVLQCSGCDLIFQEYIPNSEFITKLYSQCNETGSFPSPVKDYGLSYYSIYCQDIFQILAFIDKPPSSLKVLDFGMGWGRWALMTKALGCEVYGVELSDRKVEFAKNNGINIVQLDRMPMQKFDFINTDQVFEHLANPVDVLAELKQSLKVGGIIKICVPNSFGIRYRLHKMDWTAPKGSFKSLNPVAPLEHINCFYRKSMLNLAETVGLSEVKIPMMMQYKYISAWDSPKRILRNLLMPIYRNILGLQNYYLFKNSVS